jgi:hypothetical protein
MGSETLKLAVIVLVGFATWTWWMEKDPYTAEDQCAKPCKRGYCSVGTKSWNAGKCCLNPGSAPASCV